MTRKDKNNIVIRFIKNDVYLILKALTSHHTFSIWGMDQVFLLSHDFSECEASITDVLHLWHIWICLPLLGNSLLVQLENIFFDFLNDACIELSVA